MAINDWMDEEKKAKWKEMGLSDKELGMMNPDYVPTGTSLDLSLYPERSALDILNQGWSEKPESIWNEESTNRGRSYRYPSDSGYSGYSGNRGLGVEKTELPTLKLPTYTAPVRDENRLASLTQKAAMPGLRRLRRQAQSAILSSRGLPGTVRRMTLREALAGYGEGVSQIMGGAEKTGQSQYNREYEDISRAASLNYQAQSSEAQAAYQQEIDRIYNNAAKGVLGG